jgi:hypothetical protein
MPNFDWLRFLQANKIEYTDHGHSKGNIGITCPFCGEADHGMKLGIHLAGKGWHCWRDRVHSGIRPHRLIQALLKCSYFEAQRIVGDGASIILPGDLPFEAQVNLALAGKYNEQPYFPALKFPKEIHYLHECSFGIGGIFLGYLRERGYTAAEITELCALFDLRYAFKGPFNYRIIFPIEMYEGLACWTGRTIGEDTEPRYKTLTSHIEKQIPGYPIALRSIKDCLWNLQDIVENPGDTLVICEGPFDAMRVDYYGYDKGIRATCLFGKDISEEQIWLLEDIAPMFKDRIILLDSSASLDQVILLDRLSFIGFDMLRLPIQFKDPAMLAKKDVHSLFGY